MTVIVISSFCFILLVGYIAIYRRYSKNLTDITFAGEYRDKFVQLANIYFDSHDPFSRSGKVDADLYIWLTKNVNLIQANLGHIGRMNYIGPFQSFQVPNYQIIINTLPKFRDGKVQNFDVTSTDDALLRYLGSMEKIVEALGKQLKNPIIWFRIGFQTIISLPLYILNWFGILSDRAVNKVTANFLYKIVTGIGGLVTFVSGVVTIIQGKDQTILLIKHLFGK